MLNNVTLWDVVAWCALAWALILVVVTIFLMLLWERRDVRESMVAPDYMRPEFPSEPLWTDDTCADESCSGCPVCVPTPYAWDRVR